MTAHMHGPTCNQTTSDVPRLRDTTRPRTQAPPTTTMTDRYTTAQAPPPPMLSPIAHALAAPAHAATRAGCTPRLRCRSRRRHARSAAELLLLALDDVLPVRCKLRRVAVVAAAPPAQGV